MKLEKIAFKLKGWNLVSDVCRKLRVKKSVAYKYLHLLSKEGFVAQKIKKPRGTMYHIIPHRMPAKHLGMFEETGLVTEELEFAKRTIEVEMKIPYFLSEFKSTGNERFLNVAISFIKKIKNWKKLYHYLKAYKVKEEFVIAFLRAKEIGRVPRMPKRYAKLLGV